MYILGIIQHTLHTQKGNKISNLFRAAPCNNSEICHCKLSPFVGNSLLYTSFWAYYVVEVVRVQSSRNYIRNSQRQFANSCECFGCL